MGKSIEQHLNLFKCHKLEIKIEGGNIFSCTSKMHKNDLFIKAMLNFKTQSPDEWEKAFKYI